MKKYLIYTLLSLALATGVSGATISTLNSTSTGVQSRIILNTNFTNVNNDLESIIASTTYLKYGTTSDALTEGSTNLFYTVAKVLTQLIAGNPAIFSRATTTNATTTSLAVTGITSSFLATNQQGSVIATTAPVTFSNSDFDTRLSATTSLPNLATTQGLSTIGSSTGQTAILGKTTLTNASTTSFAITGLGSTYLAVDKNGSVLATTSPRDSVSSTATGLTYTPSSGVFSLTSGYIIPTTSSSTNYDTFYNIPSTRITAGTNLTWSSNTLNFSGTASNWKVTTALTPTTTIAVLLPSTLTVGATSTLATTTITSLTVNDGSTTGTTTVSIGNTKIATVCWWNGTNFTIEYYPPNSITKVVATSTTCQ